MLVNIHEAKTQFSKLIERVSRGETVVIGKAGKPVAKLVPIGADLMEPRPSGQLKGKLWMAPDFDELPPDIAAAFGME
jgi:prevent-host-death family protein